MSSFAVSTVPADDMGNWRTKWWQSSCPVHVRDRYLKGYNIQWDMFVQLAFIYRLWNRRQLQYMPQLRWSSWKRYLNLAVLFKQLCILVRSIKNPIPVVKSIFWTKMINTWKSIDIVQILEILWNLLLLLAGYRKACILLNSIFKWSFSWSRFSQIFWSNVLRYGSFTQWNLVNICGKWPLNFMIFEDRRSFEAGRKNIIL